MAADDQDGRDRRPIDDVPHIGEALSADANVALQQLLMGVLAALPAEALDRLRDSRVCFLAGDDAANRSDAIRLELDGRRFPSATPAARFIYLNSTRLLAKSKPEALFLVARTVAEALLWHEGKAAQAGPWDLEQLAEQTVQSWGFERPRRTLLAKLRNAIGLC